MPRGRTRLCGTPDSRRLVPMCLRDTSICGRPSRRFAPRREERPSKRDPRHPDGSRHSRVRPGHRRRNRGSRRPTLHSRPTASTGQCCRDRRNSEWSHRQVRSCDARRGGQGLPHHGARLLPEPRHERLMARPDEVEEQLRNRRDPGRPSRVRRPTLTSCERSRNPHLAVQAISRRRPSSAASRATRSRLRSAHRPETRSSRRLRTARCSTSGPTLAHTDTPRRT
jgi:hypothetical protein